MSLLRQDCFRQVPYMAAYYATKAYMASLTRAVALELKQRGSRVYVGALCPGSVNTEFNDVANVEFALVRNYTGVLRRICVKTDEKTQSAHCSNS